MENTGIGWTKDTWNPFRARTKGLVETKSGKLKQKTGWACVKVSAECAFCYAETVNMRFGTGLPYTKSSLSKLEFYVTNLGWLKKIPPSLIFVNSMTDFFLPQIPDAHRHQVLDVMEASSHIYQVLTKHPNVMLRFSKERKLADNFWAGISVGMPAAVKRLPLLQQTDVKVRFISFEPLIAKLPHMDLSGITQAITGGESGIKMYDKKISDKRGLVYYANKQWHIYPERIDWIRAIRDNAQEYGVKFFHKQWGGVRPESAGCLLDGREWKEMPDMPEEVYLNYINSKSKLA